jgi:hypothetical protein
VRSTRLSYVCPSSLLWNATNATSSRDPSNLQGTLQFLLSGATESKSAGDIVTKWGSTLTVHIRTQVLYTVDGDSDGSIYSITPL